MLGGVTPVSKWLVSKLAPPFISQEKAIWKGSHNPIRFGDLLTTEPCPIDDFPSKDFKLIDQRLFRVYRGMTNYPVIGGL